MENLNPNDTPPYVTTPWSPVQEPGAEAVVRRTCWLPVTGLQFTNGPDIIGLLFELTDDWEVILGRFRKALTRARAESSDVFRIVGNPLKEGVSWVVGGHDDVCALLGRRFEEIGAQVLNAHQWRAFHAFPVAKDWHPYNQISVSTVGFWLTTHDNSGHELIETDVMRWDAIPGFKP